MRIYFEKTEWKDIYKGIVEFKIERKVKSEWTCDILDDGNPYHLVCKHRSQLSRQPQLGNLHLSIWLRSIVNNFINRLVKKNAVSIR